MLLLFAFLSVAFLVMLIVGLVKPTAVVFWSKSRTRAKVLLVYGLGAIVFFLLMGIVSPDDEVTKTQTAKEFYGQIVYEASVTGDESSAKSLAEIGIPSRTIVQFGRNGFQCTEEGGLTDGTFLTDTVKNVAWFLDHQGKKAIRGVYSNIDANANDMLKNMLPYTFRTELEKLNETQTICGFSTTKYKVLKSGFVRDYATAYVWITKDLKLPLRRYDFQTERKRMVAPLPLALINDVGAILKAEVHETGVIVTYTATSIETKDFDSFSIPEGYSVAKEE